MIEIIYSVEGYEDYAGGELLGVFTIYDKAVEYANNLKLGCVDSVLIYELKLDEPEYKERKEYYRHG